MKSTANRYSTIEAYGLDAINLNLLLVLQDSGRIGHFQLSKRVGLSPSACHRRVRNLVSRGVIRGVHTAIDPSKLGLEMIGFISVELKSQSSSSIKAFLNAIAAWNTVREAYQLQGEMDFILKCIVRDEDIFCQFVTNDLLALPNVRAVSVAPVIRCSMPNRGFDIP